MKSTMMIALAAVMAVASAAWAGCRSDFSDAVQTCRLAHPDPDHLVACVQSAKDDYDSCVDPLDASTQAKVQEIVHRFQETNQTPGVLVAIWSPRGRFVSATGVADLVTGEPLNADMQFKIASQTKTFTANLILQLVGEGRISARRPYLNWIAGVPNGDQITLRELLNHTSGLGDGFSLPAIQAQLATGCTVAYLLTTEASAPPVAAPGVKWSYSNYGYNLLGRVVELVTGQDLSTAIQQRIAIPLGLQRTLLPTAGNGLTPPFTHGYGTGEVAPTEPPSASDDATALPGSCLWAHGGMVSTLADMHIWSEALATGALLKPAVWSQAKKNAIPFEFAQNYNGPGRWRYGLGFVESGGFVGRNRQFRRLRVDRHVLARSPNLDRSGVHEAAQRDHASAHVPGAGYDCLRPAYRLRANTGPSSPAEQLCRWVSGMSKRRACVDGPLSARGERRRSCRCGCGRVSGLCIAARGRWPRWVPRSAPKRKRDLAGRHPTRVVRIVGPTDQQA